ncbi:MAG: helix-turn-helix transcriptional regulator [Actinomycetota bacterium]|nr:helix-turn-helix transcriptional regulator [Actinomycetota bacterium]
MLSALGVDPVAERVYRQMLARPDWGVAELGEFLELPEQELRDAFDRLFELALVRQSLDQPGELHAVGPDIGLQAALARQQAELARRQRQVAESQATVNVMIAEHADARRDAAHSDAEQLLGMDVAQDRLEQLALDTTEEVLTFMPGGAQSPAALRRAGRNDSRLLERDVSIRTIGLDSIRNDHATLAHARFLAGAGAQFRTAPVLPPRMIVADRRTALLPIDPDNTRKGLLFITSPGIVASLLALFEQAWEIATPLGADREPDRQGLPAQERALLKLLGQGFTDDVAAARLGVSPRTARRMMAELMERLGARSRFEAGLKAARHGWL